MLDLIFSAFQQHEYYNFKDLVQKTQQPVVCVCVCACVRACMCVYTFHCDHSILVTLGSFLVLSASTCFLMKFLSLSMQSYLREILREVCQYSVKAPHRNMWHLKPEYRHYQTKSGPN